MHSRVIVQHLDVTYVYMYICIIWSKTICLVPYLSYTITKDTINTMWVVNWALFPCIPVNGTWPLESGGDYYDTHVLNIIDVLSCLPWYWLLTSDDWNTSNCSDNLYSPLAVFSAHRVFALWNSTYKCGSVLISCMWRNILELIAVCMFVFTCQYIHVAMNCYLYLSELCRLEVQKGHALICVYVQLSHTGWVSCW